MQFPLEDTSPRDLALAFADMETTMIVADALSEMLDKKQLDKPVGTLQWVSAVMVALALSGKGTMTFKDTN